MDAELSRAELSFTTSSIISCYKSEDKDEARRLAQVITLDDPYLLHLYCERTNIDPNIFDCFMLRTALRDMKANSFKYILNRTDTILPLNTLSRAISTGNMDIALAALQNKRILIDTECDYLHNAASAYNLEIYKLLLLDSRISKDTRSMNRICEFDNITEEEKLGFVKYIMSIGIKFDVESCMISCIMNGYYNIFEHIKQNVPNTDHNLTPYNIILTSTRNVGDLTIDYVIEGRKKIIDKYIKLTNKKETNLLYRLMNECSFSVMNQYIIKCIENRKKDEKKERKSKSFLPFL